MYHFVKILGRSVDGSPRRLVARSTPLLGSATYQWRLDWCSFCLCWEIVSVLTTFLLEGGPKTSEKRAGVEK